MWVSKWAQNELKEQAIQILATHIREGVVLGENARLMIENTRQRSDLDWFKHRLTQVELERGQLIQAAIGVKISVPAFEPPQEDPSQALHEMVDLTTVGEDAVGGEGDEPPVSNLPGDEVDYSAMPGYLKKKE